MNENILITGAAGFIGFHTSLRFLEEGKCVVGLDCVNDYYSVELKEARIKILQQYPNFRLERSNLIDRDRLFSLFASESFTKVINLAAQAGVRYSLEHPQCYIDNNITGFLNILEACRYHSIGHLVYASSSSVYGSNTQMPFSVSDGVDKPVSLYAASKKSNELMAHTYSHLFNIPTTGLRFFTVYGPWGRPDMALFLFTKAILAGEPINVFNYGKMRRDFTYIDDIVEGIYRVTHNIPTSQEANVAFESDPSQSHAPYRLYNIGNDQPVELQHMIACLEKELGQKAHKNYLPMQAGDVPATWANIDALKRDVDFAPSTSIEEGIANFVRWYKDFYVNSPQEQLAGQL